MGLLKLDRDLLSLDLETTGTDPARDRIVQIAMVRITPAGHKAVFETLVDPEVAIPPEATEIHHLTDAAVRGAPRFRDIAPKVLDFLEGADLGGFGIIRFDIPVLQSEFRRAGYYFDPGRHRVVDSLILFHRMEPRTLAAAYEFYCGKPMEHAHDARTDAEVALAVLSAQVDRYQGRPDRPNLPTDIEGLAGFCAAADPKNVDSRGKLVWRHGVAAFNFGKYQTRSLEEVVRVDPGYVEWLASGETTTAELAQIFRRALAGEFPKRAA